MKNSFREPWFIRRALYLVISAVLLVLSGIGIVQAEQIDSLTATLSTTLGTLLGAFGTGLAATKTNRGSDSTATYADLETRVEQNEKIDSRLKVIESAIASPNEYDIDEAIAYEEANTPTPIEEVSTAMD